MEQFNAYQMRKHTKTLHQKVQIIMHSMGHPTFIFLKMLSDIVRIISQFRGVSVGQSLVDSTKPGLAGDLR